MNVLVDTNILVRLTTPDDPMRPAVEASLAQVTTRGDRLCICGQSLVEFWALSTRPTSANGRGREPSAVRCEIDSLRGAFLYIVDPPELIDVWLDLCATHLVRGRQTYDARIAALMIAAGIQTLVSLNPIDFARYPTLKLIVPGAR